MVVSERLSNKMVSLSKGTSSINAASTSSVVRVKVSIGPVIEISAVELVATEGMVNSTVAAELEATDGEVIVIGRDTKLVIGVDTRAFFVPCNFELTMVR